MDWVFPAGPEYLPYIFIFLGALVAFEGARQLFFGANDTEAVRTKRMKAIGRGQDQTKVLSIINDHEPKGIIAKTVIFRSLPHKMRQAGMTMAPKVFLTICGSVAALLLVFGTLAAGPFLAAIMASLAGMVIPFTVVNIARKKRVERFGKQLPDALDLMMRGLRVGHPINTTIQNVAANMPDPIGSEFGFLADQISYGDDLKDAFFDLAERIDQEDMHYLAVSVGIQHGSGGNLSKMLGTLAKTIRGRAAMRRKVKAISAEGRISAIVLSLLPFLIFAGTSFTAPDYYTSVQDDPMFMPMAMIVGGLLLANFLTLRKLATFRL